MRSPIPRPSRPATGSASTAGSRSTSTSCRRRSARCCWTSSRRVIAPSQPRPWSSGSTPNSPPTSDRTRPETSADRSPSPRYGRPMHLAERMNLRAPYSARPYRGRTDHPAMAAVLAAYREYIGQPELPTVEQLDATYSHLTDCDPDSDIALIETPGGDLVAYCRASWTDLGSGVRDCILFNPVHPDHLAESLFRLLTEAQERHMQPWSEAHSRSLSRLRRSSRSGAAGQRRGRLAGSPGLRGVRMGRFARSITPRRHP